MRRKYRVPGVLHHEVVDGVEIEVVVHANQTGDRIFAWLSGDRQKKVGWGPFRDGMSKLEKGRDEIVRKVREKASER